MAYARDPFDTDEPPCFCAPASTDPSGATAEFCPEHGGDPDKPAPEPTDEYTFTRNQLVDALEGITTKVMNGNINIGAEPMADAILSELDGRPKPKCAECNGTGEVWTDPHECTCGTGPQGYYGIHERGCGSEPCPSGCPYVPAAEREGSRP
jgi:hypothetical protein